MFTFGIFSTHIPYIAFLFFYLSYFLFSGQPGKLKEKVEEVVFGKKEIAFETEQQIEDKSFFYAEHEANDDCDIDTGFVKFAPLNLIVLGPGDRDDIAHSHEQNGVVVNRPPPSFI